ncbi:hypothetical protein BH10ACI4_BH10ACI4_34660 [soil metagenome]
MATRLVRQGANCATVMAAGGWTTYDAMTGYAGVDPEDSRRGYEDAMAKFDQASKLPPQNTTLSLKEYLNRQMKTA